MKTARILVADANSSFLLGAMTTLSQLPQVEIVGCNAAASEAIEQVEALVADVLVLDADTLSPSGWLALRRLLARPKRPRVVVTSEDLDGENCFLARVAGADVCLRKEELGHKLFPMVGARPTLLQEGTCRVRPAL
jgi:DNA-binding NarL/FixJ family response regulator